MRWALYRETISVPGLYSYHTVSCKFGCLLHNRPAPLAHFGESLTATRKVSSRCVSVGGASRVQYLEYIYLPKSDVRLFENGEEGDRQTEQSPTRLQMANIFHL